MSRDVGDDQTRERQPAPEQDRRLDEPERAPQERLGNAHLAALVSPLFGALGLGRDGRGEKGTPDDDEVVDAPAGAPPPADTWTDVLFGHPDWVPPRRRYAPLGKLAAWLPADLPDPARHADAGPCPAAEPPVVVPSPAAARHRLDAWLQVATARLAAARLHAFADVAGPGARRLAGPDAARARVLAVRVAAAALGLAAAGQPVRGGRVQLDLLAARPLLDLRERQCLEEGAGVPSTAALAAALATPVPKDRLLLPGPTHVPRAALMTTWADLLRLRAGTVRLAPEDHALGAALGQGSQSERDALEDRATALYADLLRTRARMAGALEALADAALPHAGLTPRPGLLATALEVDRLTGQVLDLLRHLGQGLYPPNPWPLSHARAALRQAAAATDRLHDQLLVVLARWTACLIEPSRWPESTGTSHPPAAGPSLDMLALLSAAQTLPAEAIPEPEAGAWPWLVAALGLTRCDALVRQGNASQARVRQRALLGALWTAGDPGAVACVLAWRA